MSNKIIFIYSTVLHPNLVLLGLVSKVPIYQSNCPKKFDEPKVYLSTSAYIMDDDDCQLIVNIQKEIIESINKHWHKVG